MGIMEMSLGEFRFTANRENREWSEWEQDQRKRGLIKKCKSCGQMYSSEIAVYQSGKDEGKCQSCRGEEGELIL